MPSLAAHGLSVTTPPGWEGRIFRRPAHGEVAAEDDVGPAAPPGAQTFPVLHVATIPLPANVADYASDAVGDLGANDSIIVLKEFAPANAASALFGADGLPRAIDPDDFAPNVLQRRIVGQGGYQHFFHEATRAFCLYVVLGAYTNRIQVAPGVDQVLANIAIDPTATP
jgi:hypothetical protein